MRTVDHTAHRQPRHLSEALSDRGLGSQDIDARIAKILSTPQNLQPVPFVRPRPPGPRPPINHSIEDAVREAVIEVGLHAPGVDGL
jgi:hypothetical protein